MQYLMHKNIQTCNIIQEKPPSFAPKATGSRRESNRLSTRNPPKLTEEATESLNPRLRSPEMPPSALYLNGNDN